MLNSNIFISLVPVLIKIWMLLWTPFMQSPYIFFFINVLTFPLHHHWFARFLCSLSTLFHLLFSRKRDLLLFLLFMVKHVNERSKHLTKVFLTKCRRFISCQRPMIYHFAFLDKSFLHQRLEMGIIFYFKIKISGVQRYFYRKSRNYKMTTFLYRSWNNIPVLHLLTWSARSLRIAKWWWQIQCSFSLHR